MRLSEESGPSLPGPPAQGLDRVALPLAIVAWLVPMAFISVAVFRDPAERSLDPLYRSAFDAWRNSTSMYTGYGGVNYLPTFMAIYAPFEALPQPWGQLLWRWLAAAGFAHSLWSLLGAMERPRLARGYLLLTLATLPITLGAIQMAQANAWLGVALMYAAAGLARSRLALAATWLAVGLAVKPLMVAAMGLAATLRLAMIPRLAVATAAVLALPVLMEPAGFVADEYRASFRNLTGSCLWVEENRFADLNGIFRVLGMPIDPGISAVLRVAAGIAFAAATVAVSIRTARLGDREASWLWWVGASAAYLMLFNPMTESNSYCLMGIPMALWAWRWLGAGEAEVEVGSSRRFGGRTALGLGWTTLAAVAVMGTASEALRPWFGNSLDLWLLPSLTLAFLVPMTLESLGRATVRPTAVRPGRGVAHA